MENVSEGRLVSRLGLVDASGLATKPYLDLAKTLVLGFRVNFEVCRTLAFVFFFFSSVKGLRPSFYLLWALRYTSD